MENEEDQISSEGEEGTKISSEFGPGFNPSYNISEREERRRRRFSAGYVAPRPNADDSSAVVPATEEAKGDKGDQEKADEFYSKGITYKEAYKDVSVGGVAWDDTELISKPTDVAGSGDKNGEDDAEVNADLKKGERPRTRSHKWKSNLGRQLAEVQYPAIKHSEFAKVGDKLSKLSISDSPAQATEDAKEGKYEFLYIKP